MCAEKFFAVKKLLQDADILVKHSSCTVGELAEKIGMSTAGMLYRFHMINSLANNVRRKILRSQKIIGGH